MSIVPVRTIEESFDHAAPPVALAQRSAKSAAVGNGAAEDELV
jgi:hypothetical protein